MKRLMDAERALMNENCISCDGRQFYFIRYRYDMALALPVWAATRPPTAPQGMPPRPGDTP